MARCLIVSVFPRLSLGITHQKTLCITNNLPVNWCGGWGLNPRTPTGRDTPSLLPSPDLESYAHTASSFCPYAPRIRSSLRLDLALPPPLFMRSIIYSISSGNYVLWFVRINISLRIFYTPFLLIFRGYLPNFSAVAHNA